jgi:hypothetical protein
MSYELQMFRWNELLPGQSNTCYTTIVTCKVKSSGCSSPARDREARAKPFGAHPNWCSSRPTIVSKANEERDVGATETQTPVGAHLVGGLYAPDVEQALRTTAGILGRHLYAITDGETGDRSKWARWQLGTLTVVDGIGLAGGQKQLTDKEDYAEVPALAIGEGVERIPDRVLGYADAAESSYGVFCKLRDEGVISAGVKFQVSVPTPYAVAVGYTQRADQERFLPIYADAMEREVQAISESVGDDLLLQYDVAVEIGVLAGAFEAASGLGDQAVITETLVDAFDRSPDGVEQGIHLCYGDRKNRHFAVPEDLSLCVELANAVAGKIAFAHMPVDRDTGRSPGYFEPLQDLTDTRLALGVIDYDGDYDRVGQLIDAAYKGGGGRQFAVATECGMARIDARGPGHPSLERLLAMHARAATPIR